MNKITNKITNATATYDETTYTLTVKANDGYKFDVAPVLSYFGTYGKVTENLTLSDSGKTATRVWTKATAPVNKTLTVNGETVTAISDVIVTGEIANATISHTYKDGVCTITVTTNSSNYALENISGNYGTTPVTFDITNTKDERKAVATFNVEPNTEITVTGETVQVYCWITKNLTNCTGDIKDYYKVGEKMTLSLKADTGKVFNVAPTLQYYKPPYNSLETQTFTVSSDKTSANLDFDTPQLGRLDVIINAVAIVEEPVATSYGAINVYVVTEQNLKDFATLRFAVVNGEYYVYAIDYGSYINRLKRIFCDIPHTGTDTLFCGNYNTKIQVNTPDKTNLVLDFGDVKIPTFNNDATDYESEINLFVPFVGNVSVPTEYIGETVNLKIYVDVVTGDGLYILYHNGVIVQKGECNPSQDVLYRTTDMQKVGGDEWNENKYMGLEPYIFMKWYESKNPDGRNNDLKRGKISSFTGFNSFDNVVIQPSENMLAREQESISTTLSNGVYIE
jgi:hypothetical protein